MSANNDKHGTSCNQPITGSTKQRKVIVIALPLCFLAFSLSLAAKTVIHLVDAQGKSVGTVILWDHAVGGGVGLELNLENLLPGEHALHFH